MAGQESTGGLWLKGRRRPGVWPGAGGAFQHLGERHCRARLRGGAGIWTRRCSGWCWAFLRSPAPCSGGSRQVPGETRRDFARLALQGSPVVPPRGRAHKGCPTPWGGRRWRKPLEPAAHSLHRPSPFHDLGKALPLSGSPDSTCGHWGFLKQGAHRCQGQRGAGEASSGRRDILCSHWRRPYTSFSPGGPSPRGSSPFLLQRSKGMCYCHLVGGQGARTRARASSAP